MPRPTSKLEWATVGARIEPTAPQKAAGFSISQNPPSEAVNWLLGNIGEWCSYFDDYVNQTYPADLATAKAAVVASVPYPQRTIVDATAMQVNSLSAAVSAAGVLQQVLGVGVAGKTIRYDPVTHAAAASTWGLAVDCNDVAFGNSRYMACGATGKLRTSSDGVVWSAHADIGGTSVLASIAYSPERNMFAAVGTDATNANSVIIAGDGALTPVTRALPVASDVPRRIVWAGGSIQSFFVFTNGAVYASPNPYTTAFTQVYTYTGFTAVLDVAWSPEFGVYMLGIWSTNTLQHVFSPTGAAGNWQTIGSNSLAATPISACMAALPNSLVTFVSSGSAFACFAVPQSHATSGPDRGSADHVLNVLGAKPRRAKVLHNALYVVGNVSGTDAAIYASTPLETLRPYSRG
jgi:hypothetical protein